LANLGEPWQTLANLGKPWRTLANDGSLILSLSLSLKLGEAWRAVLCCAGQRCFPARQSSFFDFSSTPMQLIGSYLVILL
jgi:hypothetical protein